MYRAIENIIMERMEKEEKQKGKIQMNNINQIGF